MDKRSQHRYTARPSGVAQYFDVSERTVRRMCKRGELPSIKVAGQWRIRSDWKEVYLQKAAA